jgi:hypothetical protein
MIGFMSLLGSVLLAGSPPQLAADFTMPKPPGPYCPLRAADLQAVDSYRSGQPILGTHFFYWYDDVSQAHFVDYDGTDALTDHPTQQAGYSYKSPAWWKRELLDVMDAEIDFILPVYWGCPGDYGSWSFVGLPPLVQAWESLVREGKSPPRVGLFYDTSTLRHNPRSWHVDLSTRAGKQWFYATIRDYFSLIPPKMWAAIDERPIVVLYSAAFAAKQDPALFPYVREQFRRDFATDLYLIKNVGWEGEADSVCSWGGALGLQAYGVTSLGPGYDHSAVPNRQPLVVEREGGAFYERLWSRFLSYHLQRRATTLLIETWNELHEGTEVCDTREFGRQYIDLTAKYARLFHDGTVLPKTGPFAGVESVSWGAEYPDERRGIAILNSGDGLVEPVTVDGQLAWRTRQSEHGGRYLYVDLHESFVFDEEDTALSLEITYLDRGFAAFTLQYDGNRPSSSVREGAFASLSPAVECQNTGQWQTTVCQIRGGRFANRCNGADLRLAVAGGDLTVRSIVAHRQQPAR